MSTEKHTYLTIDKTFEGEVYKEKGSKFIGYAFSVINEEEIKNFILKTKENHPKARHWCYAWQLGIDTVKYRANDDGEPNNSAGKPIYGQLLSNNITNVLIVVVRYYGGTKLGVGGLISAYKKAASNVLEIAKIKEKIVKNNIGITFEYKEMNVIMRLVKKFDAEIIEKQMDYKCYYIIAINKSNFNEFKYQIKNLKDVNVK